MEIRVTIDEDAEGWNNYNPEEFITERVAEHVIESKHLRHGREVRFSDVSMVTSGSDVLGLTLSTGGYTMPHTDIDLLQAPDGITCTIAFSNNSIEGFSRAAEDYVKDRPGPRQLELEDVTCLEVGEDIAAISFENESGYTLPPVNVYSANDENVKNRGK